MVDISKHYPGVIANQNIHLSLAKGEILALLGENGAGKSTLVKMIYGVTQPTTGRLIYQGEPLIIKSPNQAKKLGIGMVFQHFSVFETLTVTENIALGISPDILKKIPCLKSKINELSKRFDLKVDPQRYVHSLSIGERQRVEILRCLVQDVKLLILDEPTSVLTPQEVTGLFNVLKQLASQGCSILFISHKLKEVQSLCDFASVLRAGRISGKCNPKEETTEAMARLMVGDETPVTHDYVKAKGGDDFLTIRNLSLSSDDPFGISLKDLNFTVKSGEILVVAGVAGNGQSELLAAISGERLCGDRDAISFPGVPVGNAMPDERRRHGLAVVPEDRLGQGAVPDMSLWENGLLTAYQKGLVKKGLLQAKAIETEGGKIQCDA